MGLKYLSLSTACLTLCLIALPASNEAARILGIFPSPSKSHLLIHCATADAMAQAGHEVTVISTLPNINEKAKYKHIHIDVKKHNSEAFDDMVAKQNLMYVRFAKLIGEITEMTNNMLLHSTMQKFLRENGESSFDLLLFGYAYVDFHMGLIEHFKCPVVVSYVIRPLFSVSRLVGNPQEASYVPTVFSGLRQPLNFLERLQNFGHALLESVYLNGFVNYYNWKYYERHFPATHYPPLHKVKQNISLLFTNHHFSQGPIQPNLPNVIEIGGIQIKEQVAPLPADIALVLGNAKAGVIYFSLGSIAQGSNISPQKLQIIFNVLSKLPYTILWKWSGTTVPGSSPNIIYKSWLPQSDILAHPNLKLFITHCGQGSVVESLYHGVPMVGMPLFLDQPTNMVYVESAGFGLPVDMNSMTEESLSGAVLEVLENPKYAEAAKKCSKIYRDRPLTSHESVAYWTDYVLRHEGAKHLRSPAIYLNRWQLMSLDVIGCIFGILAVFLFIFVKVCKLCCGCTSSSRKNYKYTYKKNN